MKALLLSIKPEHVINILNGKKTLELRKRVPKGFKGWVYCYVTKGKPILWDIEDVSGIDFYGQRYLIRDENLTMSDLIYTGKKLNGTIPFRFWFDEYNIIYYTIADYQRPTWDGYYVGEELLRKLCLTELQVNNYGKGKDLYAWHIKNLDPFYEPMQLSNFKKEEYAVMPNGVWPCYQPITKAPQSYMYVYVKEAQDD